MLSDSERKMNSEYGKTPSFCLSVKVYFLTRNVTFVHELPAVCYMLGSIQLTSHILLFADSVKFFKSVRNLDTANFFVRCEGVFCCAFSLSRMNSHKKKHYPLLIAAHG